MGENGIWGRTGQNRMDNPSVRKVLFFIWVSDKFKKECPNKYAALIRNSKNLSAVSHENIYHTVLGFYNITNKIYKKELDLFTNDAKPFAGPMRENIPHGTFFDKVNFIE